MPEMSECPEPPSVRLSSAMNCIRHLMTQLIETLQHCSALRDAMPREGCFAWLFECPKWSLRCPAKGHGRFSGAKVVAQNPHRQGAERSHRPTA